MLGVHPAKVSQSLNPALLKIARLMLADPLRTSLDIIAAMRELRIEQDFSQRQIRETEFQHQISTKASR